MRSHKRGVLELLLVALMWSCASTKVTDQQQLFSGKIPRPDLILVYEFAATPEDVPDHSALAGQHDPHDSPQTPEQTQAGRALGKEVAHELAADIDAMGLRSEAVPIGTEVPVGDLVIKGYLVSVDAGSEKERILVGFGKGASELKTVVEGFQSTPEGLRKLGGGTVDAGGSKSPGAALGIVGAAATHNPAGLIVSTGMKIYGEESGKSKLEGRAKATAKEIAEKLRTQFQRQGWIQ